MESDRQHYKLSVPVDRWSGKCTGSIRKGDWQTIMDIRRLWKLFLYAGLEKEEYTRLLPTIHEENRALLKLFSQLGAVMFFLLYIVSMLSQGFVTTNSTTYMICAIGMLAVLFCVRFILPNHLELVTFFVYLFEILLFAFSIYVSMLHVEKPAVSAVAFLLVSPLLFYDRPARLTALIAAVIAIFCLLVVRFKTPEAAESDVWNMITFGIVSVAATVFMMSIKIRALEQSWHIKYMSTTDLLTGVKNRNCYENHLQDYPEMCTSNLICVYADANGLHEMNNRLGHAAGDEMLRAVAKEMLQCFGEEHTYRIGGDEFVAFRVDGYPEDLPAEIDRARKSLQAKSYNASFGTAVREKVHGELDLDGLLSEAEAKMYDEKRAFYRQSQNDRRSR